MRCVHTNCVVVVADRGLMTLVSVRLCLFVLCSHLPHTPSKTRPPKYASGGGRRPTGRPRTSPPLSMSRSKSTSALPSKLLDLTADLMPRPLASFHSPTSRQSNHSAFSPQGSGGFSPALLPLRKARTHYQANVSSEKSLSVNSKDTGRPQLGRPPSASALPLTSSRETLTFWALQYVPGQQSHLRGHKSQSPL